MTVILHNFRGIKYLINTNNINSVSFSAVDSKQYADEIAEAGGSPLTRIYIDWYGGSSTGLLATSEVADEFLNLFENAIEIF
jgi:hypothetical protein